MPVLTSDCPVPSISRLRFTFVSDVFRFTEAVRLMGHSIQSRREQVTGHLQDHKGCKRVHATGVMTNHRQDLRMGIGYRENRQPFPRRARYAKVETSVESSQLAERVAPTRTTKHWRLRGSGIGDSFRQAYRINVPAFGM